MRPRVCARYPHYPSRALRYRPYRAGRHGTCGVPRRKVGRDRTHRFTARTFGAIPGIVVESPPLQNSTKQPQFAPQFLLNQKEESMFEILVVIIFFLLAFSVIIMVPILLVIKAAQAIFGSEVDEVHRNEEVHEHKWRHADASERERIVRKACAWRVIARVAGSGALCTGAFVVTSPGLVFACCVAAWRVLRPIKQEMRDACAYKSTGADDEPRY